MSTINLSPTHTGATTSDNTKKISFKIMETLSYVTKSTFGRFILTFLTLHTAHFMTIALYSNLCINVSIIGYFTSIINGHGPLCHGLLTAAYYAQHNIYTLLGTAAVGAGITWLTENIFSNTKKDN